MKDFLSKLNWYDRLGYSFSWALFIIIFLLIIWIHLWNPLWYLRLAISMSIWEWLIFLIIAYFIWHIIQWLFLLFEKTLPKSRDKELEKFSKDQLETVIDDFKLSKSTPKRIVWSYRYLYSLDSNLEPHINQFNMLHYFFKWLFSTSFFITIISIFFILANTVCSRDVRIDYLLFIFWFFLICSIIFYLRMNKFYDYLSEKICVTYELKRNR